MNKKTQDTLLSVLIVVLITLAMFPLIKYEQIDLSGTVTIPGDSNVNIRSSAYAEAPILAKAKPGNTFACTGETLSGWYKIAMPGDEAGYIPISMAAFGELPKLSLDLDEINARIEANPNDALAYQDKGEYYVMSYENQQAYDAFSRAIELEGTAQQYARRAAVLRSMDDYDGAYEDANRAVEIDDQNPEGHVEKAWVYFEWADYGRNRESYDKAKEAIETALALDPTNGNAYHVLGCLLYNMGRSDEAIKQLVHAKDYTPARSKRFNLIGLIYRAKGKDVDAIRWYSEAIASGRDDGDTWSRLGVYYSNRGQAYYDRRDYVGALADFHTAITFRGEHAMYYDGLARSYYELKEYRKAMQYIDKAIEISPEHELYHTTREKILEKFK